MPSFKALSYRALCQFWKEATPTLAILQNKKKAQELSVGFSLDNIKERLFSS